MLLFSTDAVSPNTLLYEVARHNFSTYVVRDFDIELMNFGPLGLLIIKGFANQAELNHYRSLLARDGTFTMPEAVRPVEISRDNFDKLLQGGGSFDDYFRFTGEETIRATHESVLPPDEYPPSEEMYAPAPDAVSSPDVESVEPSPATPDVAPEREPEPEHKSEPVPAPVAKPAPAPVAEPTPPVLPSYPIGSEGDEED